MEVLQHKTKYLPLEDQIYSLKHYLFDLTFPCCTKYQLHRPKCTAKAKILMGYSRKKANRGVEDMESSRSKNHVEFPAALVLGLKISEGCDKILWSF